MNASTPLVSAVMAARAEAPTIAAAVESVLRQTLSDLELIVVDDASTDETAAIVKGIADPRVRLVQLGAGRGRGGARNEALRLVRGRFVAVCDADDVSLPDRFAQQSDVLRAQPEIGVVGGQVLNFGEWGGPESVLLYPTSPAMVEARFARGQMPVPHQASMIRADLLQQAGGYAPECLRCQDLELFLRLRTRTTMTNVPDVVLLYRHGRRTPLRYWLRNGAWRRYAVARSTAVLRGERPPSYAEHRRGPGVVGALAWDCASYARAAVHQRVAGVRSL